MKATEYADLYREESSNPAKAAEKVFRGLISEMDIAIRQRDIRNHDDLYNIVMETINKWRAFVRIINADEPILDPCGFEAVLERHTGLRMTPTGIIELKTDKT